MKKKEGTVTSLILWLIAVAMIIISTFYVYARFTEGYSETRVKTYLSEVSMQNAKFVESKMVGEMQTVKWMAALVGEQAGSDIVGAVERLSREDEISEFKRVGIILPDGSSYASDGIPIDASDRQYFKDAMAGKTVLTQTLHDKVDGKNINVYCTPVYDEQEIIGALFAAHRSDVFLERLNVDGFDGQGLYYIIDQNGTIIVSTDMTVTYSTIFDALNITDVKNGKSPQTVIDDMQNGTAGMLEYIVQDEKNYFSYTPLSLNGWYLVGKIPAKVSAAQASHYNTLAAVAFLFIIFILFLFFAKIVHYQQIHAKAVYINEARYRMIMEQVEDVIFEFNIQDNTMYYSPNFKDKFGYEPKLQSFLIEDMKHAGIHPADCEMICATYRMVISGETPTDLEVRIRDAQENDIWCRIHIMVLCDKSGVPVKAMGRIMDIDQQKKEIERLKVGAQRDGLTGLYNKNTIQSMVEDCLKYGEEERKHALFVIDIDNFKGINDNLGHLFGDAVLSDVASKLQKIFRSSDLVGRIGGDEFLVFLKDCPSQALIESKAKAVCEAFQHTYTGEKNKHSISASVGIAIYPEDGVEYNELFKRADMALYYNKSHGKNNYALYAQISEMEKNDIFAGSQIIAGRQMTQTDSLVSAAGGTFKENIIINVFEMLYQAKNIAHVIQFILGMSGAHYDVSRVYIFENSADNLYCSNTYEWCKNGIPQEKENLQNVPYSELGGFLSKYNEAGVFYCEDIEKLDDDLKGILKPQGIKSLLHVAVLDNGVFRGYVGFDECSGLRAWTQSEVETLSLIAKILGIFLIWGNAEKK